MGTPWPSQLLEEQLRRRRASYRSRVLVGRVLRHRNSRRVRRVAASFIGPVLFLALAIVLLGAASSVDRFGPASQARSLTSSVPFQPGGLNFSIVVSQPPPSPASSSTAAFMAQVQAVETGIASCNDAAKQTASDMEAYLQDPPPNGIKTMLADDVGEVDDSCSPTAAPVDPMSVRFPDEVAVANVTAYLPAYERAVATAITALIDHPDSLLTSPGYFSRALQVNQITADAEDAYAEMARAAGDPNFGGLGLAVWPS